MSERQIKEEEGREEQALLQAAPSLDLLSDDDEEAIETPVPVRKPVQVLAKKTSSAALPSSEKPIVDSDLSAKVKEENAKNDAEGESQLQLEEPQGGNEAREEDEGEEEGDDEDDDEEDEEEEDEEDEDEDDEGVRSRKKRRGNQFLDVEAEVDDDDEDEEDDEEAEILQREFLADDQAHEEPNNASDRLHRKLDRSREKLDEQDAQALADQFKARYGRSSSSRFMGSTSNVSQRLLLPSVDDPLIWGVRVRNGAEKEIVKKLYARMLAKKATDVFSVFQRDSFIGYVYIEARRMDAVTNILEGLPGVYSNNKVLVPIEEYPDLLRPGKSHEVQLQPGAYVRIKTGKYKGDLGIVDNLAENDLEVRVKLVPRLDYGRSAVQTIYDSTTDETKKKGRPGFNSKFRPPQRLFSEVEARSYDPEHLSAAKRDRGYFIYRTEEYIDGFLYKDIKIQQIESKDVKPTLHELTLFNSGSGSEGIDLQSIASSLKDSSTKMITFQPDDRVEIVSGEQAKMKGKVVSAPEATIARILLEGNDDLEVNNSIVEVPTSTLRKVFLPGDHVTVIHGVHSEESGLIVKVSDNQVTLLSDQTKKDITVFPNYLMKSTDSSTTSSQFGRFELHQMIQLNSQVVGLIIKAEKEVFTVLSTDGRVLLVEPKSIQSVLDLNRLTEKTTDKNGLEIKVGDVVKESSGERRQGNILHIYRSNLFLKSKTVTENTGIFVASSMNVQTVSHKGSILSTFKAPDLNKMNPDRLMPPPVAPSTAAKASGRDQTLAQHVSVRKGPYKGKKGIIKDANGEVARVEMHNPAKIIPINKSDLLFEFRPGNFITYEQFLENSRGGSRSRPGALGFGGQTPRRGGYNGVREYGSTPSHSSMDGFSMYSGAASSATPMGDKTPAWSSGGKTPAWSSGGGKTPSWSANGGKTPSWNANGGGKTPSWNSGGKTPAFGSSGGKTPSWGSATGAGKTPSWGSDGSKSAWGGNRTEYGGRSAWAPDESSRSGDVQHPPTSDWGATPSDWDAPTPASNKGNNDDYNPEV